MYPHSITKFSRAADFLGYLPSPDASLPSAPPMLPTACHQNLVPDQLDTQLNSEVSHNSCSSGCGSPSSLASYGGQGSSMMQRSISSHSLQKNGVHHPVSPQFAELFLDSEMGSVRRACSTDDLQSNDSINVMQHNSNRRSESPLSSESSMIIEGMSRAYPYSPEEKKVRIERYRSKRNQRNFTKKIKYACRKTLADSRPRVRGRFARNEEIEKNPPAQWSHIGGGGEEDEEDENWVNFFEALVAANLVQEPHGNSSFGLMY